MFDFRERKVVFNKRDDGIDMKVRVRIIVEMGGKSVHGGCYDL